MCVKMLGMTLHLPTPVGRLGETLKCDWLIEMQLKVAMSWTRVSSHSNIESFSPKNLQAAEVHCGATWTCFCQCRKEQLFVQASARVQSFTSVNFMFHSPGISCPFFLASLRITSRHSAPLTWDFPSLDFGDPPPLIMRQNYLLVFYSQLLKRVPVVLCPGALWGPRENPPLKMWQNSLILDFICQPFRRGPQRKDPKYFLMIRVG